MKNLLIIIAFAFLFTSCKKDSTNVIKDNDEKEVITKTIEAGLYSSPINEGEFAGELLYEGDAAPNFTINKGQENEFSMTDLQGKVVYIKFWRTNCSNCRSSIPVLIEKYNSINNEEFVVITVTSNITENVTLEQTAQFVKDYKMSDWINIYDGETKETSIFKNYSIFGTPNGYLIDKEGIVVKRIYPHEEDFISSVNEELAK